MGRIFNKHHSAKKLNRKNHNADKTKSDDINKSGFNVIDALMKTVTSVFPDLRSQNQAKGLVKQIINMASNKNDKEFMSRLIENGLKDAPERSDKKQQIFVPTPNLHRDKDIGAR